MKFIIAYTLLILGLLIYFTQIPYQAPDYQTFTLDQNSKAYVSTTGIQTELSELASQTIYTYNLSSHIATFESTFYVPKTVLHTYDGIFERAWAASGELDYATKPRIHLNGHLFKDSEHKYYILITYESSNQPHLNNYILTINAGDLNYQILYNSGLFKFKDTSIVYNSDLLVRQTPGHYQLNPGSIKTYLETPSFEGVLLLELSTTSDYFQMIIDFYESNYNNPEFQLGMNTFSEPDSTRYIPQSLILTYKEPL